MVALNEDKIGVFCVGRHVIWGVRIDGVAIDSDRGHLECLDKFVRVNGEEEEWAQRMCMELVLE